MNVKTHWEEVYGQRRPSEVSWYQRRPDRSLELIHGAGVGLSDAIIDVGGGASVLVDELLSLGYTDLTVLDVSVTALSEDRRRLESRAGGVNWIEGDVLQAQLPQAHYALWHDRALFHFLGTAEERAAYVAQLRRALRPDGHVILATFAADGPTRCSGLDVTRYAAAELARELGAGFRLVADQREEHLTPAGAIQQFTYALFRREAAGLR